MGEGSEPQQQQHYKGCAWNDLLAWYLQQVSAELVGEEQFERRKKLTNQASRPVID